MNYITELENHYASIKAYEWRNDKMAPPDTLASYMWKKDKVDLLFGFRAYLRWLGYGFIHKVSNIGLREEDFSGLLTTVERRRSQIEQEPVLKAYWDTISILRKDLSQLRAGEVHRHLAYLYSNKHKVKQEDYVDCISMVFNYCTKWSNEGEKQLVSEQFWSNVLMLEGKYGKGWSSRKHSWLPHQIFSNMALMALKLNDRKDWRDTRMALIESPAEGPFTVYDWILAFLRAYRSRVHPDHRAGVVNYVKLRMAVHREDYPEAAKWLAKVPSYREDPYGMPTRMLSLIIDYELRYCRNDGRAHPALRKLKMDPETILHKLKMNIRDLRDRQGTLLPHARNFQFFVDGYTELLALRRETDLLGKSEKRRREYLRKRRPAILAEIANFRQHTGDWLRNKIEELK